MSHFLLVHGAWHGARHWDRVAEALRRRGHAVTAVDLPGHGEDAALPDGYVERDASVFASARSPVADVSLDDAARAVVAASDRQVPAGTVPVLVGHSMGGAVVTRAAELAPERFEQLVYVAAVVPTTLQSAGAYFARPEASSPVGAGLYVGDPAVTGAVRIDPRSTDPAYLDELHRAYFTDVTDEDFAALAPTLTPDQPVSFVADAVAATADRWGSLRRSYMRTTQDQAVPVALQDLMIGHADATAPTTAFVTATLEAGHAPIVSRPDDVVDLLESLTSTRP